MLPPPLVETSREYRFPTRLFRGLSGRRPGPCREAGRRAGPGLERTNHSGKPAKGREVAPISTCSRGLAEQLATVVATFSESWVSREIPGGDRAGPWLEVFARVAGARGLPGGKPHCTERSARERRLASIHLRWSAGTRRDTGPWMLPETVPRVGQRCPVWTSGRLRFSQSPRSWCVPVSTLFGNLSAAPLQGTVVIEAASLADGGGDPEAGRRLLTCIRGRELP
ncbi:hypothetical protein NN561_013041 [Cricetulus griseus]